MSSSLFNVGHCLLKFSLSSINSNAEYKEDIYHSFKQRSSSVTFLFIATLGPVQPFIASSRRTRDLFAGSALLSELSKAAARAIVEQEKSLESLIFPAPSDKDTLKSETSFN